MKLHRLFVMACLAALALSTLACSMLTGENKKQLAASEIKMALADMVALMEKGEAKQMLKKYALPETLAELEASGSMDAISNAMGGVMRERVVEGLKSMQVQEPLWNEDFTQATFQSDNAERPDVLLVKREGRWHINMNRPGE